MPKKSSTQLKALLPYLVSFLTLLISAFLSWRISVSSVKSTVIQESRRELLVKESAVLNRVMDIAKESKLVFVGYVTIDREIIVTSYLNENNEVEKVDTTIQNSPTDTSLYYIPRFAYYPESNKRVLDCLDYIECHFDDLGLRTYEQVYKLVRFANRVPITLVDDNNLSESRWTDLKVINDFNDLVNEINQSYLQRLSEFGLD